MTTVSGATTVYVGMMVEPDKSVQDMFARMYEND
jgi:hypothetical protein